jgi:putative acetyltransferase
MEIRPATQDNAPAVRRIFLGVLDEFDLGASHVGADADLDDIHGNYVAGGGAFDVMVDDRGCVVGCAAVYAHSREVCELRKMHLLPEFRGQGLGRELLDRMVQTARALGFNQMVLETADILTGAIKLYRTYGFRPVHSEFLGARGDHSLGLDLLNRHSA